MSYAAVMQQAAKQAHAAAGDAVTYTPGDGGEVISTHAIPLGRPLGLRDADERKTSRKTLLISVPKLDVGEVVAGSDEVTLPGKWIGSGDATVTLTVVKIDGDRTSEDAWVLRMRAG